MGKFWIQRKATGYLFVLKAANGETIALSEVYSSRAACEKGAGSVAKAAARGRIRDLTTGDGPETNPKFELFQDKAGAYRFRLRSRNGQIIAASDGYSTKAACQRGIESVIHNAPDGEIMEE